MKFTLKKLKRSRSIRLTVKRDGSVLVTAPIRAPMYLIEEFVQEKEEWVKEKVAHFKSLPPVQQLRGSTLHYKKHKAEALALVQGRTSYWSKIYGYRVNDVSVKNQKTRWGSCSKHGNLNFNYKILFLSERVRDYIVVHEICHLKEFNHGPKFWALVAKSFPDYKEIRKELKKGGIDLG